MAAAGSVEAVVTMLALEHGLVPPTANLGDIDPAVPFDCVPGIGAAGRLERGAVELVRLRRAEREPDLQALAD